MSLRLSTHKVETKSLLALEDQQRFWRRLHHYFSAHGNLREKNGVWVDVIYRPDQHWEVYFSSPPEMTPYLTKWFRKDRKRSNKLEVNVTPTEQGALAVPQDSTICELKLAFDNLFALPAYQPTLLPQSLPLKPGEAARISFCIRPIPAVMWNHYKPNLMKSKMEQGIRMGRGKVEAVGWIRVLLYYITLWMERLLPMKNETMQDVPWLSQGTIRKLNDCHFETYVRIAAPQRFIAKLARPFQGEGGENQFIISFLPRKEEKTVRKELDQQRLSLLTRSNLNPNILGSREVSNMLSFFPSVQSSGRDQASPNL